MTDTRQALAALYKVVIARNRDGVDWGEHFGPLMTALADTKAALSAQPVAGVVAFKGPAKWLEREIEDGYRGIRWIASDGVYGVPTLEDVMRTLGYAAHQAQAAPAPQPSAQGEPLELP